MAWFVWSCALTSIKAESKKVVANSIKLVPSIKNEKRKTKTRLIRKNRFARCYLRAETLQNYELLTLMISACNQSK